jgi:hypothetical protein
VEKSEGARKIGCQEHPELLGEMEVAEMISSTAKLKSLVSATKMSFYCNILNQEKSINHTTS